MNLPVPLSVEALAGTFARDELEWFRANSIRVLGLDVNCLDEADGQRMARHCLKLHALASATNMMEVVDYARAGWDAADRALRELIAEFLNADAKMPVYLQAYAMDTVAAGLVPTRIPGPKPADRFFRDIAIAVTVGKVARQFSLKHNRSGRRRPSACSIVADAWGLGEAEVVAIWRRYGRNNLEIFQ